MKEFLKKVLDSNDSSSAKRLVTLLAAFHFFITAFVILFLICYLIVATPKGSVNKDLVEILTEILKDSMFIILSGLGFIGLENWSMVQLEKVRAKIAGNMAVGSPTADVLNVKQTTTADTVNTQNIETVNTQTTNTNQPKEGDI